MELGKMTREHKAAFYASWMIDLAMQLDQETLICEKTSGRAHFAVENLQNRLAVVTELWTTNENNG